MSSGVIHEREQRPGAGIDSSGFDRNGGLTVEGLVVRFGGLVAVNGITLHAAEGRLTGLIGPNGAGKTTIFNACTGLVTPNEGRVWLFGQDMTRMNPARRAQRGLGRTFQRMELFDSLTVRDNVELGREAALVGTSVWRQLVGSGQERELIREVADESLYLCGIEHLAPETAGNLSTGQRRLVELARALAGPFRLLLLDEPSSGLDAGESARFGEVLQEVINQRDVGILLVEHDIELVIDVCEYIYVLDFGSLIFGGTPDAVRVSEEVRAAYLGSAVV